MLMRRRSDGLRCALRGGFLFGNIAISVSNQKRVLIP